MSESTQILNHSEVEKIITRLAYEVYERNFNAKNVIIAAINGRGEAVANLLNDVLTEISSLKTQVIVVKIDKDNPLDKVSVDEKTLQLKNSNILLVDDVLNTGRTLLYAMLPFLNYEIAKMQTLVLVDRNHNSFPVKADFIGTSLSTTLQEHIEVTVERKKINVYLK